MNKQWVQLCIVMLILLSACTNHDTSSKSPAIYSSDEDIYFDSQADQQSSTEDLSDKEELKEESLFTIHGPIALASTGEIKLADGTTVHVYLELVSGQYQPEYYPRQFERCWSGDFQLALYASDIRKDTEPFFVLPITCQGFDYFFDILVDDYNSDGNPDFTINVSPYTRTFGTYQLFTVTAEKTIEELEVDGDEFSILSFQAPSIRLIQEEGVISVFYPAGNAETDDPDGQKAGVNSYQWDGEKFAYIGYELLDMPFKEGNAYVVERIQEMLQ